MSWTEPIDPDLALTLAAVVEEGTLDAAAARLRVTPSAVSQRLKTLEQRVGQRLLVRSKPARATPAGEEVVRFAHRLALLQHETWSRLGASAARSRVRVAVNADSLATWLLEPLARFAHAHPVELELVRDDQDRTVLRLEAGEVAAAVTSRSEPVAGCTSTPLGAMAFEAVAAPSWLERWAPDGVSDVTWDAAPRVDYDRGDQLQVEWLRRRGHDAARSPRHLVPSTHAISAAVELGLGWALLPPDRAAEGVAAGRLVRLGDDPVLTTLHWQRWKERTLLLDALTAEVVDAAHATLRPL